MVARSTVPSRRWARRLPVGTPAVALLVLALWPGASRPAVAQDEELEPLLLLIERGATTNGAQSSSLQIYRVPLDYTARAAEGRQMGVRLTFPVSLGAYRVQGSTAFGPLSEEFSSLTVTPGVEMQVNLGPRWALKPFGEVGLTATRSGSGVGVTYGIGVRARSDRELGTTHLTLGGAARYASPRTHHDEISDYTTLEFGGDVQVPLGLRVGERSTAGGVYGIVRYFPDLQGPAAAVFDVGRLYEVGLSFSTIPAPRIWFFELPWIALGYRFGGPFSGVRLSFSFPF